MKLIWRVGSIPTGRYRSFEKRLWPGASFNSVEGPAAASIDADESYNPCYSKKDDVGFDLKIRVTIPTDDNRFEWKTLKKRVRSIKEAKELVQEFYEQNPKYIRGGS